MDFFIRVYKYGRNHEHYAKEISRMSPSKLEGAAVDTIGLVVL
jgi:hypothetical protein